MSDAKKYEREFIILNQETSGYGITGQKTYGSITIEVKDNKGKISGYVQGLKQPKKNSVYCLYLITPYNDKYLGVKSSLLYPDDNKGQDSIKWEFTPSNVANSGISIDKFSVFAVIYKNVDKENIEIIAPLVGYKDGEIMWKHQFIEFSIDIFNNDDDGILIKTESIGLNNLQLSAQDTTYSNKGISEIKSINISGECEFNDEKHVKYESSNNYSEKEQIVEEFYNNISSILGSSQTESIMMFLKESGKTIPEKVFIPYVIIINEAINFLPKDDHYYIATNYAKIIDSTQPESAKYKTDLINYIFQSIPEGFHEPIMELTKDAASYLTGNYYEILSEILKLLSDYSQDTINSSQDNLLKKNIPKKNNLCAADKDFYDKYDIDLTPHLRFKEVVKNTFETFGEIENNDTFLIDKNNNEQINNSYVYLNENELKQLFLESPKLNPFINSYANYEWIRVPYNSLSLYPIEIWSFIKDLYIFNCYRKYKHFILGRFIENKKEYYLFGIPDEYNYEHNYNFEKKGVVNFKCIDNKFPENGDLGYWMINFNINTNFSMKRL